MSKNTPEDLVDKIRADVTAGLREIFDDEIESLDDVGVERRVKSILEDFRDRLLSEPGLPKDR